MKNKLNLILVILTISFLSSSCAIKAVKSKKFWIETSISAGAALVDGITTQNALKRCSTCYEQNKFLGSNPTSKKTYFIGFGSLIVTRGIVVLIWQKSPEAGTRFSTVETIVRSGYHSAFAYQNTKVKEEKND